MGHPDLWIHHVIDQLRDSVLQVALGRQPRTTDITKLACLHGGIHHLVELIALEAIAVIAGRRRNNGIGLTVPIKSIVAERLILHVHQEFLIKLTDGYVRSNRAVEYPKAIVEKRLCLVIGHAHIFNTCVRSTAGCARPNNAYRNVVPRTGLECEGSRALQETAVARLVVRSFFLQMHGASTPSVDQFNGSLSPGNM